MSFVASVNPYQDILCEPYYYLFPIVAINWMFAWLEVYYHYLVELYREKLQQSKAKLEESINSELRQKTELKLSQYTFNNQPLPKEIVSLIMSMLPLTNEIWTKYRDKLMNRINMKRRCLSFTQFLYPIARFIGNLINFICIIVRYADWYETNTHLSSWRKYNGFILAMLYMPTMKGRGIMTLFAFEVVCKGNDEYIAIITTAIGCTSDLLFMLFVIIAAFPVMISGAVVFIPTGLLSILVVVICWAFCYWLFRLSCFSRKRFESMREIAGFISAMTLLLQFVWTSQTVSIMEFFDGELWTKAYRFGFFGEYCYDAAYFQSNKWSQYQWDIKFLIISWIMF